MGRRNEDMEHVLAMDVLKISAGSSPSQGRVQTPKNPAPSESLWSFGDSQDSSCAVDRMRLNLNLF